MPTTPRRLPSLVVALTALLLPRAARAFDVVINAQGEFADAYLVNGTAFPPKVVFIDPDPVNPDSLSSPPPRVGRHDRPTPRERDLVCLHLNPVADDSDPPRWRAIQDRRSTGSSQTTVKGTAGAQKFGGTATSVLKKHP